MNKETLIVFAILLSGWPVAIYYFGKYKSAKESMDINELHLTVDKLLVKKDQVAK